MADLMKLKKTDLVHIIEKLNGAISVQEQQIALLESADKPAPAQPAKVVQLVQPAKDEQPAKVVKGAYSAVYFSRAKKVLGRVECKTKADAWASRAQYVHDSSLGYALYFHGNIKLAYQSAKQMRA